MAIRAWFVFLAGGLSLLLAPGVTPGSAEPFRFPEFDLEQAAAPLDVPFRALADEAAPGGLRWVDEGPAGHRPVAPATIVNDPWAEAATEVAVPAVTGGSESPAYDLVSNQHVLRFLDRFTGARRDVVGTWFERSGRYLTMIRDVLRKHGLPEDLAFVAMIESGFHPLAVSRAGAKGLWQFMAGTARRYGLRVDQWVDERLDPEKSTVAAAAYLRDLYAQFGSWSLAQAAYNAGELTVSRAIRAVGSNDFWALARSRFLQAETKDFVPQIQAATMIGRNPDHYGFEVSDQRPVAVETVRVPPSTNLARLSVSAGISAEMLRALNPVLVRGMTPPGTTYELRVPAGTRAGVLTALAAPKPHPSKFASATVRKTPTVTRAARTTDIHVVRPRDTISGIAKRYGVTVSDVVRWNGLHRQDQIRPGDRLRVTDLRVAERSVQPPAR